MSHILPKSAMYLHGVLGDAQEGSELYELVLINMSTPAVRSRTTGKTFVLPWSDVVAMAKEAGIDE